MGFQKLKRIFNRESEGGLTLVRADERKKEVCLNIIEKARDRDITVTLLLIEIPSPKLRKAIQERDLNGHIRFVDCVTKTITNDELPEEEHVKYVDEPHNLSVLDTQLSMISKEQEEEEVLMIIDSLAPLFGYNSSKEVGEFLRRIKERSKTLEQRIALVKEGGRLERRVEGEIYGLLDRLIITDISESEIHIREGSSPGFMTIHLHRDIPEALGWGAGESLNFSIEGDDKLLLKK